jgi:aspartyl-tRNA(Asn)/glutamyl-tRNA(Gln) amidotransferase subunit B
LLPLRISADWIAEIRATLPEMPGARAARLAREYQIPDYDATVLTDQKALADYFEATAAVHPDGKQVSNWIMTEVLRVLKDKDIDIAGLPVSSGALAELLGMIDGGTISGTVGKDVFDKMIASGQSAGAIVESEGLTQVSDDDTLGALIDDILRENPNQIASYRAGKTRVLGFFVGEAMKRSKGMANPQRLSDILRERLGAPDRK